ncbi:MAG: PAAR-like domain-containing protein [Limisphaerales bacterium]
MGLPASSKAGGQAFGFPDVCKTPAPPAPPIPIPYPNLGMMQQMTKTATKVKMGGMLAVIETSEISMSQGDEAGTVGGVVSGKNMDKIVIKKGSAKVQIEGKGCAYLTCLTTHNGANANMPAGKQIAPSQVQVMVAM